MDPLTPEILLSIFSRLDLSQVVISRRICKDFLEVIDHNQVLWREMEWIQKEKGFLRPAVDMVDEKSKSTIESVSFEERVSKDEDLKIEKEDLRHLIQVLHRSREALKYIYLRLSDCHDIQEQLQELASHSPRLNRLILWDPESVDGYDFPLSRLVSLHQVESDAKSSSGRQLQVLWLADNRVKLDDRLLKSLVSFAQDLGITPQHCRQLTSNFSETIVHLRMGICRRASSTSQPPILCPNLKAFEGFCVDGFSTLFNAPQLRIVVLYSIAGSEIGDFPPSVEEIWLQSRIDDDEDPVQWNVLSQFCPKLKVLKLTEDFVSYAEADDIDPMDVVEVLESREKRVREEKEIDGIKFIPLQKLVVPLDFFDDLESIRAERLVGEIIDVKDYPDYIEIEY